jgi:hypothetical protein
MVRLSGNDAESEESAMLNNLMLVWALHPHLSDGFLLLGSAGLAAVIAQLSAWN